MFLWQCCPVIRARDRLAISFPPLMYLEADSIGLDDWMAASKSFTWEVTTPRWALMWWSLLSANRIKFLIRTSVIRSRRCSSSRMMSLSSMLKRGGRIHPKWMWHESDHRVSFIWVRVLAQVSVYSSSTSMFHLQYMNVHVYNNMLWWFVELGCWGVHEWIVHL